MRVSVELIPRNEEDFAAQLDEVAGLTTVDTVNVPDLMRFEMRSWDACARARARGPRAIPHLRAIDVDPSAPLPFLPVLDRHGIDEVLVVAGDAPADMSRPVFDTDSVTLIRRLKEERPETTVYAALDPYRQGFAAERDYVLRKLEAGADGLFTQPFFDARLMRVWGDLLDRVGTTVFWGATSVTSDRSARYWTSRNKAVLPAGFAATLAHSRAVAHETLAFARDRADNAYFMPIRIGPRRYLSGIL